MNDKFQSGDASGQGDWSSQAPINDGKSGQIPFDQPEQTQSINFVSQSHEYSYAPKATLDRSSAKTRFRVSLYFVVVVALVTGVVIFIALIFRATIVDHSHPIGTSSSEYAILREGSSQVSTMRQASEKLDQAMYNTIGHATNGSESGVDADDVERIKKYAKEFEDANAQFGELEAADDEEVHDAYVAYMDQAKKFAAVSTSFADFAVPLSEVNQSCSDTPSSNDYDDAFYAAYEDYVNTCKSDLNTLDGISNEAVSDYASSMGDYVDKVGDIIAQMKALGTFDSVVGTEDEYTQFSDLLDEFSGLGTPLSMNSDLSQNLTNQLQKADPSDELNELFNSVMRAEVR